MFQHPLAKEAVHASPLSTPDRGPTEVPRSYDLDIQVHGIDVEWMAASKCEPDTWDYMEPTAQKATCKGCPVASECLAYASAILASEAVYGGRWMWKGQSYPIDSDIPKQLNRNAREMERAR